MSFQHWDKFRDRFAESLALNLIKEKEARAREEIDPEFKAQRQEHRRFLDLKNRFDDLNIELSRAKDHLEYAQSSLDEFLAENQVDLKYITEVE